MQKQKKTLVLGASPNPSRYSYAAVKRLNAYNHPVIAIGKRKGSIGETIITNEKQPHTDIDTVTLYLNPMNQKEYYEYLMLLNPKRIIFNPGTENDELAEMASRNGIQPVEACTLVMLSTNQY